MAHPADQDPVIGHHEDDANEVRAGSTNPTDQCKARQGMIATRVRHPRSGRPRRPLPSALTRTASAGTQAPGTPSRAMPHRPQVFPRRRAGRASTLPRSHQRATAPRRRLLRPGPRHESTPSSWCRTTNGSARAPTTLRPAAAPPAPGSARIGAQCEHPYCPRRSSTAMLRLGRLAPHGPRRRTSPSGHAAWSASSGPSDYCGSGPVNCSIVANRRPVTSSTAPRPSTCARMPRLT